MWKKSEYSGSIEVPLNIKQTAEAIEVFKKVRFLYLDIYGKIYLKETLNKDLEQRIGKVKTIFLSEIFNVKPTSLTISGSKCINTSPNNAPAEKLTKYNNIFFNLSALMERVNNPKKEIKLTLNTLTNE